MAKYVYPALFTEEEDGGYSVAFPDIKNCFTCGDDMADALDMAEDALCLMLYDMEKDGREIPAPSDIREMPKMSGAVASLVSCDTEHYKRYYSNKLVKKTLNIPMWLNEEAEAAGVNFSQTLQRALKETLGHAS
jgi:predicted RNase H-like HicB family nuclease